jgi:hypothetical protein
MKPKILLVNPPIYDFAAYDFWLKPYGLLRVAAKLEPYCQLHLFDFLYRISPEFAPLKEDLWGRGEFPHQRVEKPSALKDIPRYYNRFGRNQDSFLRFLDQYGPFHFALIQTSLTYWYPGVREVIEILRCTQPQTKIILGGFYASCCRNHAQTLGADCVISDNHLAPLWNLLGLEPPDEYIPPYWQAYPQLDKGIMTLTEGCPFRCSYCYQPLTGKPFQPRSIQECIADYEHLARLGTRNIAFYDDALLVNPHQTLIPFLDYVLDHPRGIAFHTPNALHARLLTPPLAEKMARAGFQTFYLGFESASRAFQEATGQKVYSGDLAEAVDALRKAGIRSEQITAYILLGHPKGDLQQIEESMHFAHELGIRIMLADFSPIPGTRDGELCRQWTDLDEPLNQNKTAFPIRLLGREKTNYFKELCRRLNRRLPQQTPSDSPSGN